MNKTLLPFALFILSACAEEVAQPVVPTAPPPPPLPPVALQPPALPAAPPPAPAPPLPFKDAYRHLLEQMVAVDTSHGGETKLLEPIAALYRELGVPVQIIESSAGRGNLIARLHGSGTKKPLLLLAHVDVVPVEGQPWSVPPFAVTDKDGFVWGRGVNDDKSMAAAIVAMTTELARDKTPLTRDVIVALTAGEETGGGAGAHWLADHHKELLDAEVALNEGGGIRLSDDGERAVSVDVSTSEKTYQTFKLSVKGAEGHSSTPPTDGDAVTTLARALDKVGSYRFPARILPEAKTALAGRVAESPPALAAALRHALASAPKVSPADETVISKDRVLNANIRTTCIATTLHGSPQDNVLPTSAEAQVNCRILPDETRDAVLAKLKALVGDPKVDISLGTIVGAAGETPADGEVFDAVKRVTAFRFPSATVGPSMTLGATDSRFLREIGIRAYGVGPVVFSMHEIAHLAHGTDERASAKWLVEGASFLRDVTLALVLPPGAPTPAKTAAP
jgi:acetylornithine deacetylase/succinyl-diaminopimelate desuccinylase-like protein